MGSTYKAPLWGISGLICRTRHERWVDTIWAIRDPVGHQLESWMVIPERTLRNCGPAFVVQMEKQGQPLVIAFRFLAAEDLNLIPQFVTSTHALGPRHFSKNWSAVWSLVAL